MRYKVYLALGSNMGNRENNLSGALELISKIPETEITACSKIYETEPVGYLQQDMFLNMAICLMTSQGPLKLLEELQKIEGKLKRTREIYWGPRTIDIDILLYDGLELSLPGLTIPHPRMYKRAFVLIPLKEIYCDCFHNGAHIDELINQCSDKNGVRLYVRNY